MRLLLISLLYTCMVYTLGCSEADPFPIDRGLGLPDGEGCNLPLINIEDRFVGIWRGDVGGSDTVVQISEDSCPRANDLSAQCPSYLVVEQNTPQSLVARMQLVSGACPDQRFLVLSPAQTNEVFMELHPPGPIPDANTAPLATGLMSRQ